MYYSFRNIRLLNNYRNLSKTKVYLVLSRILDFILASILVTSSVGKIISPMPATLLASYFDIYNLGVIVIIIILCIFELLVAYLLILNKLNIFIRGALGLTLIFVTFIIIGSPYFELSLDCGCFGGIIKRNLNYNMVILNILLVLILLFPAFIKPNIRDNLYHMTSGILISLIIISPVILSKNGSMFIELTYSKIFSNNKSLIKMTPYQISILNNIITDINEDRYMYVIISASCSACKNDSQYWSGINNQLKSYSDFKTYFISVDGSYNIPYYLDNQIYTVITQQDLFNVFKSLSVPVYVLKIKEDILYTYDIRIVHEIANNRILL